jgi:ABC-type antimicrobial peptide transport system permease subunit
MLFEVSGRDPVIYALVALAMVVVTVLASFVLARRAASVDPNLALRHE